MSGGGINLRTEKSMNPTLANFDMLATIGYNDNGCYDLQ